MQVDTYQLKIIFLNPILGSQPTKDVASEIIAGEMSHDIKDIIRKRMREGRFVNVYAEPEQQAGGTK